MKLLSILILAIVFVNNSALSHDDNQAHNSNDKVKLSLFYESLCPFCLRFIREQLKPTYNKIGNIMDLEIFAYGNIQEKEVAPFHYTFHCQHGAEECKGNKILECAKLFTPSKKLYFKFVFCMMESSPPFTDKVGTKCSLFNLLPWKLIKICANSEVGDLVLHDAGVKQHSLDVKPEYVPWILINNDHKYQDEAQQDLKKVICKLYSGKPIPAQCQNSTYFQ